MCCPSQDHLGVLLCEVRRKQGDAAQVKTSIGQHRKEHGVFPRRSSHRDAEISLGLGEVQNFDGVFEHGRASLASKEPAVVYLADMGDKVRLDPPRVPQELREPAKKLIIGNCENRMKCVCARHTLRIARVFFASSQRLCWTNTTRDDFEASPNVFMTV